MRYLKDAYGDGHLEGHDILWNPSNHRVLEQHDFEALSSEKYNVKPWKFVQTAVRSLF